MIQQQNPPMQETEFEIDRNAVKNYFVARWILFCILACGLFVLPPFVSIFTAAIFIAFAIGFWLCPQQANNLRYRLEGNTVRADGGVFFLFRKSIPLERITDVALVQGPLLRYFGIWAMRIQTAGSAQCEATLYGVRNPEEIRELILSQRQRIYGEKTADA